MAVPEYSFTIKELPEEERPREKLLKYGAEQLSNSELLALIIRTGSKDKSAIELSRDLLCHFGGLKELVNLGVEEIKEIKGIGVAKGTQIKALIELSKRIFAATDKAKIKVNKPQDIINFVMPELRYARQEIFKLVLLNVRSQVISCPRISKGGLTDSVVHPRDVFREAIRRNSAAMILVHNHPSGIPEPSQNDIKVTRRLKDAGDIIGIEILDHLIIGDGKYVSMKEKQLF